MKPVVMHRRLHFVVAIGNEYVSTPSAYGALDSLYHDFDGARPFGSATALDSLIRYLSGEDETIPPLFNIFEDAVLPLCPIASRIRARMQELGAGAVLMSGSGPSVFGIFSSSQQALGTQQALLKEGYRAFAAASV